MLAREVEVPRSDITISYPKCFRGLKNFTVPLYAMIFVLPQRYDGLNEEYVDVKWNKYDEILQRIWLQTLGSYTLSIPHNRYIIHNRYLQTGREGTSCTSNIYDKN